MDNAVTSTPWDPQVSHDDLIRHIQQVETGIEHLKEGQDRMLQKQDLTNGHVRELREWRAVQEALERERDAERKALQQERAETANRIRILMDAETARIAAANTTDKTAQRAQFWLNLIVSLLGGAAIADLIKHLLK